MNDPIMNVKNSEELKELVDTEKDTEEYRRLLKAPQSDLVARIKLFHKYGEGECPCNHCKNN